MAAKAKPVDWLAVEADYRAGILTDRVIAKKHGKDVGIPLSHTAVQKKAKAQGWTRDLASRIEKRREDKVAKAAVAKKGCQLTEASEKQVVEANASMQTNVILGHRSDIQALRAAVAAMAGELGALANTDLQDALELVLDEKTKDATEKRAAALEKAYHAAMALGSRAGAGQKLASALGILIDKERQAFGIDKGGEGGLSLGEFLNQS